jgi:small subunit ribosomal protein S2
MILSKNKTGNDQIETMFSVGAHFGYDRSRRHPSALKFIFGRKSNVEIFDLEKTAQKLEEAKAFITKIASENKQVLFVGGKREAQAIIENAALKIDQPHVAGRWIGGTLTNFEIIRKRVTHYLDLLSQKEKGELVKYKKNERRVIEKQIIKLESRFAGISNMDRKPGALFIIDADRESIARDEAIINNIPVVSLSSTDCNFGKIDYVIPANDSSVNSIKYFTEQIVDAFETGKQNAAEISKKNAAEAEKRNAASKTEAKSESK